MQTNLCGEMSAFYQIDNFQVCAAIKIIRWMRKTWLYSSES